MPSLLCDIIPTDYQIVQRTTTSFSSVESGHESPRAVVFVMLTDAFWLRTRRSRFVFFLICSPLLIPLLCASIPLLCAAEIFSRLRSRHPWFAKSADEDDLRLRRCEEGCNCGGFGPEEAGLLQRYLEDQLILVRSVYDCGEGEQDQDPDRYIVPLLS